MDFSPNPDHAMIVEAVDAVCATYSGGQANRCPGASGWASGSAGTRKRSACGRIAHDSCGCTSMRAMAWLSALRKLLPLLQS